MKHDVVYILKNDYDSEELRYSLRSVCVNFPYRKIVFVGGMPAGIEPDIRMEHQQEGLTKWKKARSSLIKALMNEDLTENIWLFNDDFFVMDRVKANEDINYFDGSLERRILELRRKNPAGSNYINNLDLLRAQLLNMNRDTLSFALHVPMLINRQKALELLKRPSNISSMFRSYYGNYYKIDCRYMEDVKVYDLETVPDTAFVSTTDESFKKGRVGELIRTGFPKPCKYEIVPKDIINTEEGETQNES